jgi:hypothetical protein
MSSGAQKIFLGPSTSGVVIATVIAGVAAFVGYNMWLQSKTMPIASGFTEGFGGVAVGSGIPDCLRTSSEGAQIAGFFTGRSSTVEEGADDLRELLLLLGKLSCFKKDLMGVAGIIEATRYQPYSTAHDIESVAETTARCFAKTIPPRDLEIIFDKWSSRGTMLIRRLCTAYETKPQEFEMLKNMFENMIKDVKDVAGKSCFVGTPIINGKEQGRDVNGYQPNDLVDLGPYKGRY